MGEKAARLRHVARGPDVGDVGAHVLIDQNPVPGLDAAALEKIGHRRNSRGDEQQVRLEFGAVGQRGAAACALCSE